MEQEERGELLNFLYKDSGLIDSLYAQLFFGLLRKVEDKEGSDTSSDGDFKCNVGVVASSYKRVDKSTASRTEHIDPHDLVLIDLLKSLQPSFKTSSDALRFGDVVFLVGGFLALDKSVTLLGMETHEHASKGKGKKHGDQLSAAVFKFLRKALDIQPDESNYYFFCEDGLKVCGTIKNDNLCDGLNSLLFKFGPKPIHPVCMVGIVETGTETGAEAENPFQPMSLEAASLETLRMIHLTAGRQSGSIAVRPVAIFYRLNITSPTE